MERKRTMYMAASTLAPLFAVGFAFAFANGAYVPAWVCGILIVVSMKTRIYFGGRQPHNALFWTHLAAAIPFLLGLTLLTFVYRSSALIAVTLVFTALTLTTGAILWYRGVRDALAPVAQK